jgi:TusE/DsrC/DsvC family sulfur relay protein
MDYQVNGTSFPADEEGYLVDITVWNKELADLIAIDEKIDMNSDHWEVVNFLRDYY